MNDTPENNTPLQPSDPSAAEPGVDSAPSAPVAVAEAPQPPAPPSESASAAPAAYAVVGEVRTPGGKSIPRGLLVGLFALLAVVAVGAAALLGGFFDPDPKTVLTDAYQATVAAQTAELEALYQRIPMLEPLLSTETVPTQGSFSATFRSIEGIQMANLISEMFGNSGFSIQSASDPDASAISLNGTVFFTGRDLLDFYTYLSPELLASGIPSISGRNFSLSPATLLEDYKNSAYYDPDNLSDAQMAALQDFLNSYIAYYAALGNLSAETFQADVTRIFSSALSNASYEKGDKVDGLRNYTIAVPGADIKRVIIEYYRYLYQDSDFSTALRNMMEASLKVDVAMGTGSSDDFTYNEVIDAGLAMIEESCPEMPTTIVLSLDGKKIIRKASLVAAPAAPPAEDAELIFGEITMDLAMENDRSSVNAVVNLTTEGNPIKMSINAADLFDDSSYSTDMEFVFDTQTGGTPIQFSLPISLSIDKDGNLSASGSLGILAHDEIFLSAYMLGTMTREGDQIVTLLPNSRFTITTPYANPVVLTLDFEGRSGPLPGPIPVPDHTPALSLTPEEYAALGNEYQRGFSAVLSSLGL